MTVAVVIAGSLIRLSAILDSRLRALVGIEVVLPALLLCNVGENYISVKFEHHHHHGIDCAIFCDAKFCEGFPSIAVVKYDNSFWCV